MKIAIIGAGNVGSALAHGLTRAGHTVTISSSDTADAGKLAADAGASAAENNRAAATAAEMIVLAVPFDAVENIVSEIGDALDGRAVVDVTNRFSAEDLGGPSNAEQIQRMAPGARVVKAFNTVFAGYQADPRVEGTPLDGFVAGDDDAAKRSVIDVLDSLGFRSVDAGPLAMARALEGMGTLNIALNSNNDWSWRTAWKLLGPLE